MKILITGGAGFIGSNLAKELVKQNHEVTILDNLSNGNLKNIKQIKNKIKFIKGDIRNLKLLKKAFKNIQAVSHQAALISVIDSIKNPELYKEVNIQGTKNVLEAAKFNNIKKVVFASSCAIYGNNKNLPLKESEMPKPESPYAETKIKAENLCKKYNMKIICLRYFNIFGPNQNPNSQYASVIPIFISKILKNQQPFIFGDGEQTRDFVFIKDIIKANIKALLNKNIKYETINIGSGKETSINQLITKINSILGKNIKPIYKKERKGEIKKIYADITKLKNILNITPTNFNTALKETIKCYQ